MNENDVISWNNRRKYYELFFEGNLSEETKEFIEKEIIPKKSGKKINIPNINSVIILAEDWTFNLYQEYRNRKLIDTLLKSDNPPKLQTLEAMSEEDLENSFSSYRATRSDDVQFIRVTIPKGTALSVSRVYIRNGGEAFSSITFRIAKKTIDKRFASARFWVKLVDANEISASSIT